MKTEYKIFILMCIILFNLFFFNVAIDCINQPSNINVAGGIGLVLILLVGDVALLRTITIRQFNEIQELINKRPRIKNVK